MGSAMPATTPLYDDFSADYDRFVDWEGRLGSELPFIEAQLAQAGAGRVLDVACGTGKHAIALAKRGYEVVGVDVSAGMVGRAQENAAAEGTAVDFYRAGFGEVSGAVEGMFDAVLCLGNSLPHVLTREALAVTCQDLSSVLRPQGLLLLQIRNHDRILSEGERWMPLQARQEGGQEWLFLRFYDYEPDGSIAFNVVRLHRESGHGWTQEVDTTRLHPWRHSELVDVLRQAGFEQIRCWGDMRGAAYVGTSPNLVIATTKTTVQ